MFALANNYGFTEHEILWEIPYTRALRYLHAALWANGAWTVKRKPLQAVDFTRLLKLAEDTASDHGDDI